MSHVIYAFGAFHLDVAARQVYREGEPLATLPGRLFDCVAHLIEHRDRAVSRDELIAIIWEREDSGDNLLGQLIVRARRLFNDSGDEQRVIRTVSGFGYQWVAPTQQLAQLPAEALDAVAEGADTAAETPPTDVEVETRGAVAGDSAASMRPDAAAIAPRARHRNTGAVVAIACLLLLATVLGTRLWQTSAPSPKQLSGSNTTLPLVRQTILVLPAIVPDDPDLAWLRLGVMALVNERLQRAGQAVVPSDNVAALTRGRDTTPSTPAAYAALADAALAGVALQPRLEREGSSWRARLDVVHGATVIPAALSARSEQSLDAARDVTDQAIVALGLPAVDAGASQQNESLAFVLKKAEALYLEGRPDAAAQLLAQARPAYPASDELAYQLAWMQFRSGQFVESEAGFQSLLTRLEHGDDLEATARALNGLANISALHEDHETMRAYPERVIALLHTTHPDSVQLARAHHALAVLASRDKQYDVAIENFAQARRLLAQAGDWLGVARVDGNAGISRRQRGDLTEAVMELTRAAERVSVFSETDDEAIARSHLVQCLLDLADAPAALDHLPRLSVLASRTRWPHIRHMIDLTRAAVLVESGQLQAADALLDATREADSAREQLPNRYNLHLVGARRANLDRDLPRLTREATEAISVLCGDSTCPDGHARDLGHLHLLLARASLAPPPGATAARAPPDAVDTGPTERLRAALLRRMATDATDVWRIYLLLLDAEIAIARAHHEEAKTAFETAWAASQAAPVDRLRIAQSYGPWLLRQHDAGRARAILDGLGNLPEHSFDAAVLAAGMRRELGDGQALPALLDRARQLAGERPLPARLEPSAGLAPPAVAMPLAGN